MLIFHQYPKGGQSRVLAAGARQQVGAGAHEVEAPAIEGHVVRVPRRLAAPEAVRVATQEAVLDAAALAGGTALSVTAAHLMGRAVAGAATPALLVLPHLLAWRQGAALVGAAAG